MTVAKTETSPTGKLVLTMENDQVWMQTDTQSLPPIDPGMTAVIREGFLGGYRLSVTGRTFRVRRVDRPVEAQSPSRPQQTGRSGTTSPQSSETRSEATSSPPQDGFGLPEEERATEVDDTREMTIAKVETSGTDKLVLTMENGQIWRQTDTQSLPPIDPGMTAVIREGFIGGYRLSVTGRTFRVERLQ